MITLDRSLATCLHAQFLVPCDVVGKDRGRAMREKLLEAIGSVLGMGGAVWFALRIPGYAFAYIPFVLSSCALTFHFFQKKQGWVMAQQAVFTVINLAGIYFWILKS